MRALLLSAAALAACQTASAPPPEPVAARDLSAVGIARGDVPAAAAVRTLEDERRRFDWALRSVIAANPDAAAEAAAADAARAGGDTRPLLGVPILIKDNVETRELPTTAGSLALAANDTGRDAPAVARLRAAGAIVLGKTNLSEWANFRDEASISGWSAVAGQTRNPHDLARSPCGSSSGSGAAVAAGLAPVALGTETNGSVICPAAANGIVGFKPTVGLVSRARVVPISATQDTIGPMARSVADAALVLSVMASEDAGDPATQDPARRPVPAALPPGALAGARVGVLRFAVGDDPEVAAAFETALATLEVAGATLVEIGDWSPYEGLGDDEFLVLKAEFKTGLNAYLADAAPAVTVRSLSDLIAFNEANADREMPHFGQDILTASQETGGTDDPAYREALPRLLRGTREEGIERLLAEAEADVLVAPSLRPAFLIDPVHGDDYRGGVGLGWLAAIAGTPHLTVPMGEAGGLPVGLSVLGAAWDDARVLAIGADYEAARGPLPVVPVLGEAAR